MMKYSDSRKKKNVPSLKSNPKLLSEKKNAIILFSPVKFLKLKKKPNT